MQLSVFIPEECKSSAHFSAKVQCHYASKTRAGEAYRAMCKVKLKGNKRLVTINANIVNALLRKVSGYSAFHRNQGQSEGYRVDFQ